MLSLVETTVHTENTHKTEQRLQRFEKHSILKNKRTVCFEEATKTFLKWKPPLASCSVFNHNPNRNQFLRAGASLWFLGGRIIGCRLGHVYCGAVSVFEITRRICLTQCYPVLWDGKYSTLMWFWSDCQNPERKPPKHKCIHEQQGYIL